MVGCGSSTIVCLCFRRRWLLLGSVFSMPSGRSAGSRVVLSFISPEFFEVVGDEFLAFCAGALDVVRVVVVHCDLPWNRVQ